MSSESHSKQDSLSEEIEWRVKPVYSQRLGVRAGQTLLEIQCQGDEGLILHERSV